LDIEKNKELYSKLGVLYTINEHSSDIRGLFLSNKIVYLESSTDVLLDGCVFYSCFLYNIPDTALSVNPIRTLADFKLYINDRTFAHTVFSDLEFHNLDLQKTIIASCVIEDSSFENVNTTYLKITREEELDTASFCIFRNVSIKEAVLLKNSLDYVRFENIAMNSVQGMSSMVRYCRFYKSKLSNTTSHNLSFRFSKIQESSLVDTTFERASLANVSISESAVIACTLRTANCRDLMLDNVVFKDCFFTNPILASCKFDNCTFENTILEGPLFTNAEFNYCTFKNSSFLTPFGNFYMGNCSFDDFSEKNIYTKRSFSAKYPKIG